MAVKLSLTCYGDLGQSFRAKGPMAFPKARPFGPMLEKQWDHSAVRAQIDMGNDMQALTEAYQALCEGVEDELAWTYQIGPDDASLYRGRGGPPSFSFGCQARARPIKGPPRPASRARSSCT
eukprot:3620818-Pyramimonas_sp.AAC.1